MSQLPADWQRQVASAGALTRIQNQMARLKSSLHPAPPPPAATWRSSTELLPVVWERTIAGLTLPTPAGPLSLTPAAGQPLPEPMSLALKIGNEVVTAVFPRTALAAIMAPHLSELAAMPVPSPRDLAILAEFVLIDVCAGLEALNCGPVQFETLCAGDAAISGPAMHGVLQLPGHAAFPVKLALASADLASRLMAFLLERDPGLGSLTGLEPAELPLQVFASVAERPADRMDDLNPGDLLALETCKAPPLPGRISFGSSGDFAAMIAADSVNIGQPLAAPPPDGAVRLEVRVGEGMIAFRDLRRLTAGGRTSYTRLDGGLELFANGTAIARCRLVRTDAGLAVRLTERL